MKKNIVALITPFTSNLEVNYKKIKELVLFQMNQNIDGILLLGTTSEAPTLTISEKEKIVSNVLEITEGKIPIWVGISTNNFNTLKEELSVFEKYPFNTYLIITPFYNKCTDEGMYRYFIEASRLTNKDIIIYNVPSRTNNSISIDCVTKLSRVPNIVGIKEATADIKRIAKLSKLNNDDFCVYSGDDYAIPLFAGFGIYNVVSVASNVIGDIINEILDEYSKGEVERALVRYLEYEDFLDKLFIEVNPIGIKTIMNHLGMKVGLFRLPLCSMQTEKKQVLIDSWK